MSISNLRRAELSSSVRSSCIKCARQSGVKEACATGSRTRTTLQVTSRMDEGRPLKTATARAAEAIAAAEIMFADEMGATLDLRPAAKAALILKIAAAIQAAVAEERARLRCAQ